MNIGYGINTSAALPQCSCDTPGYKGVEGSGRRVKELYLIAELLFASHKGARVKT